MRTVNILGVIALVAAQNDLFYLDQKLAAEVDPHAKELANKSNLENPIYLDVYKNGLLPNKILTTFKSPNFLGVAPPGITTFMAYQVFLSGERKGGFVYPLFLKYAIEDFDGKNNKMIMDDSCSKSGSTGSKTACPPGFKKIIINPEAREEEAVAADKSAKKPTSTTTASLKAEEAEK